jgi:hypothetical protein
MNINHRLIKALRAHKTAQIFGLGAVLLVMASCASRADSDECARTNWQHLGVEHAQKGEAYGIPEYYETCSKKYMIRPDASAYERGFTSGRTAYCALGQAFEAGSLQRRNDTSFCGAEWGLLYAEGMLLHDINRRIASKHNEIKSLETDNTNKHNEISHANLNKPAHATTIIATAYGQIGINQIKIHQLRQELKDLEQAALKQRTRGLDLLRQHVEKQSKASDASRSSIHNQ